MIYVRNSMHAILLSGLHALSLRFAPSWVDGTNQNAQSQLLGGHELHNWKQYHQDTSNTIHCTTKSLRERRVENTLAM